MKRAGDGATAGGSGDGENGAAVAAGIEAGEVGRVSRQGERKAARNEIESGAIKEVPSSFGMDIEKKVRPSLLEL